MSGTITFFALFFALNVGTFAAGKEGVIVYGQDFSFSLTVPNGWVSECGGGPQLASIQANAALWKKGETFQKASPFVYLRVNPRGKGAKDDLEFDISETKKRHPAMKFEEYSVKNSDGETASKLFKLENVKSEYVVYFYPKESKNSLSITMHLDKRDATKAEMKAFDEIVQSVNWITDDIVIKGSKKK